MKDYEFICTVNIRFGEGCVGDISKLLQEKGFSRPLIITDKTIEKLGIFDPIKNQLDANQQFVPTYFCDVLPESPIQSVYDLFNIYYYNSCDCIIAIGGGSAIDTGKALRILISINGKLIEKKIGYEGFMASNIVFMIAVPTLPGAGSELTKSSVNLDENTTKKIETVSRDILPNYTFVDPLMMGELEQKQIILGLFDALAHAVEAFTSTQKNFLSDQFSKIAIKEIFKIFNLLLENKLEKESMKKLLEVSGMAGIAQSNSMVGITHALAHAIGAVTTTPHVSIIFCILPFCLQYNYDIVADLYGELLFYAVGADRYQEVPKAQRGKAFVEEIFKIQTQLAEDFAVPNKLNILGIEVKHFNEVVNKTCMDGAIITNPRTVKEGEITKILEQVY